MISVALAFLDGPGGRGPWIQRYLTVDLVNNNEFLGLLLGFGVATTTVDSPFCVLVTFTTLENVTPSTTQTLFNLSGKGQTTLLSSSQTDPNGLRALLTPTAVNISPWTLGDGPGNAGPQVSRLRLCNQRAPHGWPGRLCLLLAIKTTMRWIGMCRRERLSRAARGGTVTRFEGGFQTRGASEEKLLLEMAHITLTIGHDGCEPGRTWGISATKRRLGRTGVYTVTVGPSRLVWRETRLFLGSAFAFRGELDSKSPAGFPTSS